MSKDNFISGFLGFFNDVINSSAFGGAVAFVISIGIPLLILLILFREKD